MSTETLIRCCAPTMACLKTGNMFSCVFDSREQMTAELRRLNLQWRKKGLRILPLRWRDGKALLLSKYGLEAKPYNTEYTDVTWETCTLRAWLNSDFLNKAFSAEEQSAILTTTVDNSSSQGYNDLISIDGNNTHDKIFLLSYAEANRYLSVKYWKEDDGNNTKSRVAPTDYAIETGAYSTDIYQTADGKPAGWWWLRMPGLSNFDAPYVHNGGSLYYEAVFRDYGVVRPAFWLNLESDIF